MITTLNEYVTAEGRWGNIGAGILPYCKKTERFLIPFRSANVMEPNTYGVWGGKVDDEDMDNIETAAKREFYEETGHKISKIIPSYVYKEPKFTYYNFIGFINNEFEPSLDWETEGFVWLTFDELLELEPKHFGLESLLKNSYDQIKNL